MSPPGDAIRVYGTSWCGQCWLSRIVLDRSRADYIWIDIDGAADAEAYVLRHNGGLRSVPTIVFPEGDVLVEPSPYELRARLRRVAA